MSDAQPSIAGDASQGTSDMADNMIVTLQDTTVAPALTECVAQMNIEDLEITGVHPGTGLEVVQIKEEPHDPDNPDQVVTSVTMEIDELNVEDDDVIFVDKVQTLKYITGEITFEEYSAHLEQQTEVKEEPDDIPILEGAEEIVVTTATLSHSQTASANTTSESPKKKISKVKTQLPRHLLGLMGEANMRYAQGNTDEAIKMCMEIIRNVPNAYEPFQTLGMIYEEQGDITKGTQYALIAAHLRSDADEWLRVADMCLEQGNMDQAIHCYNKAVRCDSKNPSLWWKRCELFERVGNKKQALHGYQVILRLLPQDAGDKYLQLARDLTQNFHANGEVDKAMDIMMAAFKLHPRCITAEDVNLLLELLMPQQLYAQSLATLVQYCGVCLKYRNNITFKANESHLVADLPQEWEDPVGCYVMEGLPVDLRAKLVVCLTHLGYNICANFVAEPIINMSPNEVGDLHLDIAEAYMSKGIYKKARSLLSSLVKTANYNLAAVWLRYGECLNAIGELQGAVKAYKKVVELAPSHLGARVSLASIQQQLGKHDEALEALDAGSSQRDEHSPKVDVSLLLHKCSLLFSQGKLQAFIDCAKELLFSHLKFAIKKNLASTIVTTRSTKHRLGTLRSIVGPSLDVHIQAARDILTGGTVTVDDLWELYLKLVNVLVDQQRFQEFEDVSVLTLVFPPFINDTKIAPEANFICLTACMMNQSGHFAYCFIRDLCLDDLENDSLWNLFCQVVTLAKDLRHNRFCLRLMMKYPDHVALGVLNGHNALIAGTYKHALGEYVSALKQRPQDPLLSLCVGITFVHLASQKFAARRNSLIVQGCSFLNQYLELRGDCQEANFNLGRAMHQIGLLHAAVHYYRRVLSLPPAISGPGVEGEIFDLCREAAFNLSLIYRASGSEDLARYIIQKHIII